jgi:uncharacterized membrane protein (DUF485 family)
LLFWRPMTNPLLATKSSAAAHDDHPEVSAANARAGLVLFFSYLAFYAGFMGLAAFAPQAMGRPVLGGVNLAITYGMGLIVGALVVAAIYMAACARNARLYGDECDEARAGETPAPRSERTGETPILREGRG